MSTKAENSKNSLYAFEKDGVIKKITYKNNLMNEINEDSGKKLTCFMEKNDFDGFKEAAKKFGYKIFMVIEL